jgi:hypothetical protein
MAKSQTTITGIPAAAERARLEERVHIEVSPRRVRAYFANRLLVDGEKVRVGNLTGPLPAEGRLRVPALAAAIYPRTARPAWATSMSWV